MSKALKIGLTVVVLGLALAGLLRATLREGTEYYKEVNEVAANPDAWQGKRLQLHGYVVRDSILRKRDSLEYRFKVTHKVGETSHVVAAQYTGIVPDTFADDAEVVLKGTLGRRRFPGGAERRDGEVSVEVRGAEESRDTRRLSVGASTVSTVNRISDICLPAASGRTARCTRGALARAGRGLRVNHGLPRHLHAPGRLRRLRLRRGRCRRRRAARVAQPGRQRDRRVLPRRRR